MESGHGPYKHIRVIKRSSVNMPQTLIKQQESLSVYHSTGDILSSSIQKDIIKVCEHHIVKHYTTRNQVLGGVIYECKKLSIFGTKYNVGHYIILPESTNEAIVFGRIVKLLACKEYAYFLYEKHIPTHCSKTDLYFVTKKQKHIQGIILSHQLPNFRPLEGYKVGQKKQVSISIKNYMLQHY